MASLCLTLNPKGPQVNVCESKDLEEGSVGSIFRLWWHRYCLRFFCSVALCRDYEMVNQNYRAVKTFNEIIFPRSNQSEVTTRGLWLFKNHISEVISIDDLTREIECSRHSLIKEFISQFNMTPIKCLWLFRVLVAKRMLELSGRFSITDIAFSCGFNSSAHFSRKFKSIQGIQPTSVRKDNNPGRRFSSVVDIYDLQTVAIEDTISSFRQRCEFKA